MKKIKIRKIHILAFLLLFSAISFAQQNDILKPVPANQQVTENADHSAEFIGGKFGLNKFLQNNLMFPDEAANNGSNGTVLASFVVCEDGSICNFKIVKSPDESLSKETLRVIKKMPNWTPGTKDGKAVKVNYLLPIKFIMADDFEPVKPIKVITISKQELLNSNLSDFHTAKGKIKKFEYSYQDNLSEIVESNKLSKKLKKIIKASQSNDEILMKIFVGKNTDFEKVKIIIN